MPRCHHLGGPNHHNGAMAYAQDTEVNPEDLDDSVVAELRERGNQEVQDWLDGKREDLPESAVELLPDNVVEMLPERLLESLDIDLVTTASDNPALTVILIVAGILGVLGFFYGVAKSAFKAAAFFGLVAVIAWFWFANR